MSEVDLLQQLRAPFPKEQHTANYDGFVYVDETAVSERLDEIDPNWQFQIVNVIVRDRLISVHARLTVAGVTRDGIGSQSVVYVKEKDDKGNVIGETDIETNEPEKAAATDALRRCARLFGIGRYLLGATKVAKGGNKKWEADGAWTGFNRWYDTQFKTGSRSQQKPKPEPQVDADGSDPRGSSVMPSDVELIMVKEIKFTIGKNKKYMNLLAEDGKVFRIPTTKAFADSGYDVKQWVEDGGRMFDPALVVYVEPLGKGEWAVARIGELGF